MNKQYILVSMANSHNIRDYIKYKHWREAVYKANLNLESRHHIKCKISIIPDILILENETPIEEPGRRLRGISAYLLKTYPDMYKSLVVGKRLFHYTDVTSLIDRLEACL